MKTKERTGKIPGEGKEGLKEERREESRGHRKKYILRKRERSIVNIEIHRAGKSWR